MSDDPKRVLILRRGSIGDAVVSLPALHYLASVYPNSEKRILTNRPISEVTAPLESVLSNSNLVDGFFYFDPRSINLGAKISLADQIRHWGPDLLIYLSEPPGHFALIRELCFFFLCGIRRYQGIPFSGELRRYRKLNDKLWEAESDRLLRAVGAADDVEPNWSMAVSQQDVSDALSLIDGWEGRKHFVAFSAGAKLDDKDWGDLNWGNALSAISHRRPNLGIVLIGSNEDRERSIAITAEWPGPILNLCGRCSPKVSALVMKDAWFYLGHDSGPMHLAAVVGTPCVAVFSARAKPGVWYPHGLEHQILYPLNHVDRLPARPGFRHGGSTIQEISVQSVIDACETYLPAALCTDAQTPGLKGGD